MLCTAGMAIIIAPTASHRANARSGLYQLALCAGLSLDSAQVFQNAIYIHDVAPL